MSDSTRTYSTEDDEGNRAEPGIGLALLAVLVMLIITGILCLLIYGLMVAISPIEPGRNTPRGAIEAPVAPSEAPTPPAAIR